MNSRININFTDDELLYLRARSESEGVTMTEIIRRAVRLDRTVQRQFLVGRSLYFGKEGHVEIEVVI